MGTVNYSHLDLSSDDLGGGGVGREGGKGEKVHTYAVL